MKITYVHYIDLLGRVFNGYDLHCSLNALGHDCTMIVNEKLSGTTSVIGMLNKRLRYVHSLLADLETDLGICDMLFPYTYQLSAYPDFQNADIVHYQMIHSQVLPIDQWKYALQNKRVVWTIHDPWLVTGHCVYPLECDKWKTGCHACSRVAEEPFAAQTDKSAQIWAIKKMALQDIDPEIIVSTEFMKQYITNSPLTRHFSHIHKIPFGIDLEKRKPQDKKESRQIFGIPDNCFVIAFRAANGPIKGMSYIFEALEKLKTDTPVALLTVGTGTIPEFVRYRYRCFELGWQNDEMVMNRFFSAADVFIMPSLAESFGMMAVEAMALECPIIVFDGTVLPEITFAPQCGISVPCKDSDALANAVKRLIENPLERYKRGELGRAIVETNYKYSDYVSAHLELYQSIVGGNDKH